MFFVGKKDGTPWLMIDYRALNVITVKDEHPVPGTPHLINRLGRMVLQVEPASPYHQVDMTEERQWETSFASDTDHSNSV